MKYFTLEMDTTVFKSVVFLTKFCRKLLLSFSAQPDHVLKCWKKIIATTHYFMHHGIFRPNYIFKNDADFLDFCAQKKI